ncbi:unnamed protein product [Phyllotreta striolata]|uniref:Uncharacterized protein n=1 Tax=Phyllotreta striolata TaxID=444603 RepID=A0A9P0GQQ6_PHYSR|nr:unnamed protein product [Phyllotreta striolata]
MATTEQFSLRWNNFHSNMTSGFHELLEAADMVDVTLAVDGRFLQAHKIVLSICSPFFKQMFKVNPCKHPIVILKDIGHENMKDILEFMYMGEVSVLRENLTQFLRTAELLQVKGLTGDDSSDDSSPIEAKGECDNEDDNEMYGHLIESDVELPPYSHSSPLPPTSQNKRPKPSANGSTNSKKTKLQIDNHQSQLKSVKADYEQAQFNVESNTSGTYQPVNDTVLNSLKTSPGSDDAKEPVNMKTGWDNSSEILSNCPDQGRADGRSSKNQFQCRQCMKRFSRRDHLRTHEKNIHGEFAGPFKCSICTQLYKNSESLRKHIAKFHFSAVQDPVRRVEVNA